MSLTSTPPRTWLLAGPAQEPAGAWTRRWNWGLTMALLVMIAPTLFSKESIVAPPHPFKLNFAKGVEALALGVLALWMIRHRWMPKLNLPMVIASLFVGWAAVSGFWCTDAIGFDSQIKKLVHSYATTIALFIAIRTRRDLEHAVVVWKAMSFVYAFLMLLELVVPKWMLPEIDADLVIAGIAFHRCNGPSGHSNWAGFFLGATMCLAPYFWIRYPSWRARAVLAVVTLTEGYAMVAAHVRLGILGLMVGSMWWVARGAYGARWKPVALGIAALVVAWPFLPTTWKVRTTSAESLSEDYSIELRMALQHEALRLALTYAGLGTGYGGYGYLLFTRGSGPGLQDHLQKLGEDGYEQMGRKWIGTFGTHNAYLEVMIETGVLGAALFAGIGFVLLLVLFSSTCRNKGDPAAAQLGMSLEAMLMSLAAMLVVMHAQERRVLWTLFAIGSSYVALTRNGQMGAELGGRLRVPAGAVRSALFLGLAAASVVGAVLVLKICFGFEDGEW